MSRKLFALALGALVVGVWVHAGKVLADDPAVVQACGQGGCGRDHGCAHDGVWVPYTQTKQIEKRCYTDTCEQFCLPKCSSLFGGLFGHGGCGEDCANGACHEGGCNQCEHPRTRKYLIVKVKHEEECVPACKFEHEACAAPAGTIQPMPAKPMPAPKPMAGIKAGGDVQVLEYRFMPMSKQ